MSNQIRPATRDGPAGSTRPAVCVLCGPGGDRPPLLDRLAPIADIRYAEDAREALRDTDVLFAWDFASHSLREGWDGAERLRWVHVAAAGVDRLLFPELVHSDVVVTNARGVFDQPIAEHVLACILAHAKDLYRSRDLQRERRWQHRETANIRGACVLVVGTGAIGRAIARLLRAVGMEVRGAGRRARDGDPDFGSVLASNDLAAHVPDVDYLVLAAPLTPQTRGLIDARVLSRMKPTAYLVNVGRGACVVQSALREALAEGRLAGAALDVFEREPLPSGDPLWEAPGMFVSPHMSGDFSGSLERLAEQFIDNLHRWTSGRPLLNVVDKSLGFVDSMPDGDKREGAV